MFLYVIQLGEMAVFTPITRIISNIEPMKNIMNLHLHFFLATTLVFCTSSSLANASETTELPTEVQTCDKYNTNFRVMSVKRNGPGALSVEVELENNANKSINLVVSMGKKWAIFVDNTGEDWTYTGQRPATQTQVPGVKIKRVHSFELLVGGNEATSASFEITYQIGGTFDTCTFSAKNLPIAGKS